MKIPHRIPLRDPVGAEILAVAVTAEGIKAIENTGYYHESVRGTVVSYTETETGVLVAGCAVSQIPDDGSVTAIGPYSFMWLRELTSLEIPEGVTEIGYCAFQQSVWLEEIRLPASLESIGQNAFRFCHRLKTVHYGGTVEQFRAIRGIDRLGTDFACTVYCTDGLLSIGG